jgi:titin
LGNGQVTLGIWAPTRKGGTAITGYEYSINDGVTWKAVDASSTARSLVITGLDNGTRYLVRVRAVNGAGGGAASNARSVTPRTIASAPTNVVLTAGNGRIKVDFDAPVSTGGAAIIRYGYTINGGPIISFGTSARPMWLKGLKNGLLHSVRIVAYNGAGWGAASEAVEATPHR